MTPFTDLLVLEFATVLAGPAVGMFFAELGAKVIKIENVNTKGDVTRKWKISSEISDDISAYFCAINYGKEHLFLDLKSEKDRKIIDELLVKADIILTNFKIGDDIKLNLDYASITAKNKNVIYAHLGGFQSLPQRVAFDVVLQAECGYMSMNGDPEGLPTKLPLAFMDILAAHQLKEGILTALYQRAKTGLGCKVETTLETSAIASLANQATNYLMAGHVAKKEGSLHPNIAPYGEILQTSDGELIVLAIGSDQQFNNLCNLLNIPELAKNPKYFNNQKRVVNRKYLIIDLQKAAGVLNSKEILQGAIALQIPLGRIKNMKEVLTSYPANEMILEEKIGNQITKRIKSVAFKIS